MVFVAGFIGSPAMNFLEARVDAGGITVGDTFRIRPKGNVPKVEHLGTDTLVYGYASWDRPQSPDLAHAG